MFKKRTEDDGAIGNGPSRSKSLRPKPNQEFTDPPQRRQSQHPPPPKNKNNNNPNPDINEPSSFKRKQSQRPPQTNQEFSEAPQRRPSLRNPAPIPPQPI